MSETQHNSTLELSREEMQSLGYKIVDILTEHFENLHNLPVTRKSNRSTLEKQLREAVPEHGSQAEQVIEQVEQIVFSNIMHLDHPRFFAFVPGPGNL